MNIAIAILVIVLYAVCFADDAVKLEPGKSIEKREHGKWNYCRYGYDWRDNPRYLDGKKVRWKVWGCRYSDVRNTCDKFKCKHLVLRQWQHNEYSNSGSFLYTKRYFKYTDDCVIYNVPTWCKWVMPDKVVSEC